MEKYGHSLIEVKGIGNIQHARKIEAKIKDLKGVLQAAVSVSGMIGIECETAKIDDADVHTLLRREGLDIIDTEVSVERYIENTSNDEM